MAMYFWQCISSHRYCSVINDFSCLTEVLDDYQTQIIEKLEESRRTKVTTKGLVLDNALSSTLSILNEKIDTLQRELAELSIHAVDYLCRHAIYKLEHPESVLSAIGNASWESDSHSNATSLTV
jgi:hypothetical protein